jgi:hypothetical protein
MDALARSRTQSLVLGGTALGALYLVGLALIASASSAHAPDRIAFGITLDLTLTATLIVWWLGVRRSALPGWIALAAFSWGVFVARVWVPNAPIGMLIAIGGMAEVISIGWLVLRIGRVVRTRALRAMKGRSARSSRDSAPSGSPGGSPPSWPASSRSSGSR